MTYNPNFQTQTQTLVIALEIVSNELVKNEIGIYEISTTPNSTYR